MSDPRNYYQPAANDEALDRLRAAVASQPDSYDAWAALGSQLAATGREDDAIAAFQNAVRLRPNPQQHMALGLHLLRKGRGKEAAVHFDEALLLSPGDVPLRHRVAQALLDGLEQDAAEWVARDALRIDPESREAQLDLAQALLQGGRLEEAIDRLRAMLEHDDQSAAVHGKLAQALSRLGQFAEAELAARRAIELEPASARHWAELARVLLYRPSAEESLAAARRGVELDPNDWSPHAYAARALGRLGRWDQGWAEFEWRLRARVVPKSAIPMWDGSPLNGRTILLFCEQGFGDVIQFIRYAPLLKSQRGAGRVIVRCPPALQALFETVAGIDAFTTSKLPPEPVDVALWTMSLPHRFGMSASNPPPSPPYFRCDAARAAKFAAALGASDERRLVGVVWKGNPRQANDRLRSIPLSRLAPLSQLPGVRLVSLQKDPGSDLEAMAALGMCDLGSLCNDLADLAAAMSLLDLVISVDTSPCHLAGAIAKDVWTLLSHPMDWRYMEERSDTPWYPTMRLFRQSAPGDWDGVVRQVAVALADRVSSPA